MKALLLAVFLLVACGDDGGGRADSGDAPDSGMRRDSGGGLDAAGSDAAGGEDAASDGAVAVDAAVADAGAATLSLTFDTEGGFTGRGTTDFALADGVLMVHEPFGDPMDCSATLTAEQLSRLVAAARAVDWSGVMSMYINPANPTCCCDQFTYALDVELLQPPGPPTGGMTRWCDETTGLLPADLTTFLSVLNGVGAEVSAGC